MKNALADFLQVWGFEGDTIIFSDGSLGFGLSLVPIDVACFSSEQMNEVSAKTIQFLNSLPENIDLQFVQDIAGGNEKQILSHIEGLGVPTTSVVGAITHQRIERFKNLDSSGDLPVHSLKVFVRVSAQRNLIEKPKFFSKSKLFQDIAIQSLAREVARVERIGSDLRLSLGQLGLQAQPLDAESVVALLYRQWNPTREIQMASFDPDDVRYSVLFTDVGLNDRGFTIGDMHYRIVSLKILPDQTFATMASAMRSLPFDSRLQLTIHVPNQQKEIETLQMQRRIAYSMVAGKQSGVSDLDSEAKFRDLETLLEQMVGQGERVFHASLQVTLKSRAAEDLDDQVSQTLLKIRDLAGAEGMEESLAAFDVFADSAIPNARAKERTKRLKTSNLCDLLPIYGPWSGHTEPKILLRTRQGGLLSFNPFSPTLTNSNQIVSGGSGSGKSFLTNLLLMQMMKDRPRIFIVDIGGSYKKICENFEGQNIPLGVDSSLSINPFDLGASESIPSDQKIKFLVSLVELMTKEDDESRLGKLERAELEEAIQAVYRRSKLPRLSDLKAILLESEDSQIRRMGKILGPWCGETPFGRFVDRPTTLMLERPLVAFDLKGMEALPDLQSVCLFIITDFVWREVQRDRATMKFLVLDECWKLLENEAGATFIAEVFRTFRKYLASVIAISQNIDDFAKSKVATAILPNSSIKWILKQKGADQERLKTVLSLNESEAEIISSLSQERGSYSEAFLLAEDNRSVVVVDCTPLEYWLATTDPRDTTLLDSTRLEGDRPLLEILNGLADKYPRGVAARGSA